MGIWDKVNDQRLEPQDPHDTAHTGLWGTISGLDGDQVLVACPEFDGGTHDFGPVPHLGGAPSVGDRVFLHFDSQASPAYAVAPETISTGGGGVDDDPAPGAWQALGTYLNPKWATPVNSSVTDLSDPFCPRCYVDRDRVYLGGVVLLNTTLSGGVAEAIIDPLPVPMRTTRDQHFRVTEDLYFSDTGWTGDTAFVYHFFGDGLWLTTDSPPNHLAICLDAISWRIS